MAQMRRLRVIILLTVVAAGRDLANLSRSGRKISIS